MEKINSINEKSLINKMLHFDTKYILPGLLHVEDRVSMIHSIESREYLTWIKMYLNVQ